MKTYIFPLFVCFAILVSSCVPGAATAAPAPLVVILVVDDFTPPVEEQTYPSEKNLNCVVTPDGQRYGSTGTGLIEYPLDTTSNPTAHGNTVFDDLIKQGTFQEFSLGGSNPAWLKRLAEFDTGTGKFIALGVDTAGYTTSIVKKNLSDAITRVESGTSFNLQNNSYPINNTQNIVVNMSFAIVPCNTIDMSLQDYQELLKTDQSLADLDAALESNLNLAPEQKQAIVSLRNIYKNTWAGDKINLTDDPLYSFLQEKSKSNPNLVYVASSGNLAQYGFNYPFAPAIWDFVISVSSEGTKTGNSAKPCSRVNITDYSNCGEIRDNGVSDAISKNIGTSYAAPKVSYKVAFDMMNDQFKNCSNGPTTALNVFGYATEAGDWKNLGLAEAFKAACP